MTLGNGLIYKCPFCGAQEVMMSMASGNTIGAVYWSDHKVDAPMMMGRYPIIKCPECGKYYVRARQKPDHADNQCGGIGVYQYPEAKEAIVQIAKEGFLNEDEEFSIDTWFLTVYHDYFDRNKDGIATVSDINLLESILKRIIVLLEKQIEGIEKSIADPNRPYKIEGYYRHRLHNTMLMAECYRELGNFVTAKKVLEKVEGSVSLEDYELNDYKQLLWHINLSDKNIYRIASRYEFEEASGTSEVPQDAKLEDVVGDSKEANHQRKVIIGRKSLSMMKHIKQDYYNLRWHNVRELMSSPDAAKYFTKSWDDEYRHTYYLKYSYKGSVMKVNIDFGVQSERGTIEFWTDFWHDDVRLVEFSLLVRLAAQDMCRDTVRADAGLISILRDHCCSVFRVYASTIEETYELYCKILDYLDDEEQMSKRLDRAMMILWPYEAGLINEKLGWNMITKHGQPDTSYKKNPVNFRKKLKDLFEDMSNENK